ncbi:50S ribosomal protein L6 [Candidatus Bathyarchaeota archaeon]|nr:50S ribosomal protein L6 [Candidatus Bathyarchaeota archaeon]MCK4433953.1 50S ribosomal protein L6 [Candidatus Bathyarchaeota archaeon]MCK4668683.1 50S ribosomal protein L6 [Candidatus Bathyarchaeota archaeon]TET62598.1 MAG: 50S ribosomal protein L6 [Candidatus Bathyarchaeota archaeon]
MRTVEVSKTIQIPDNVEISVDGRKVTVKGEKGALTRDFSHAPISIKLEGKTVRIWAEWPRKKEAALVGTLYSHIQNMITGVRQGFTCKLKIVFSHFPISVKVKDKTILIENFTGERSPRKVRIMGDVQVKVLSEDVIVQGINLEEVRQTAANIEQGTKVKRKDPRVFLDGIYVNEKSEGMEE